MRPGVYVHTCNGVRTRVPTCFSVLVQAFLALPWDGPAETLAEKWCRAERDEAAWELCKSNEMGSL